MAVFPNPDSNDSRITGSMASINFWERPGSPEEVMEDDNSSAQRVIDCNWSDRVELTRRILPPPILNSGANPSWLTRPRPWYHPDWLTSDGRPILYAKRVSIKPIPGSAPSWNAGRLIATYPNPTTALQGGVLLTMGARLTVGFDTPPYDVLSDYEMTSAGNVDSNSNPDESTLTRYVSKRATPAGEFLTFPAGTWKYVANGKFVAFGTPKLLVHCNLVLTWHKIPQAAVPAGFINPSISAGTGAIEQTIGHVNTVPFANCPKGSLLLLAAELRPIKSLIGGRLFDISYSFKFFQPDGTSATNHEFVWMPTSKAYAGTGWTEITTTGTTNLVTQTGSVSLYDWADFKKLFRPQP